MTSDHIRQRLPNRRFRRLLPAAVSAVTLATSAPFVAPAVSRADVHRTRAAHVAPPGNIPATLSADTTRGLRVQGISTT